MKKILTMLSAFVLCAIMAVSFTGCGAKPATKTVEVNMNPNIVFVVDNNNNVTSVEFKTDETNQIFYNVKFEGKSLEQAMEMFVNYSLISGHVSLEVVNNLTVNSTASTTEEMEAVKEVARNALVNAFENVGLEANVSKLTNTLADVKNSLVEKAEALAPEIDDDAFEAMTVEQLTQLINDKQKEFAGLAQTQIQAIQAKFEEGGVEEVFIQAIRIAEDTLEEVEETLSEVLNNKLVPDSVKAEAKKAVNEAKAFLKEQIQKFNEKKAELISQAKQAYVEIKTAYEQEFKNSVASAKTEVENHLNSAVANQTITAEQAQKIKDIIAEYSPAV